VVNGYGAARECERLFRPKSERFRYLRPARIESSHAQAPPQARRNLLSRS
jgi:hypothetical protein